MSTTPTSHTPAPPAAATTTFSLDRSLLRRRFEAAASRDDTANPLVREVARRMDERLDYIRIQPTRVLDLGCGSGHDLPRLAERFPDSMLIGADFAAGMLARAGAHTLGKRRSGNVLQRLFRSTQPAPRVQADAGALPLARSSIGLLWSNLMLPALDDPLPMFKEAHRVLEVGGLLMFSSLGPDTLRELRAALPATAGERVHRFIDMHDIGDALVKAGFSDPVMDMELITLTYTTLDALLDDLRASGGNNAAHTRPRGLSGRGGWNEARAAYEKLRTDGRLPATFEIIQGHAWKAAPRQTEDGRDIIRFQPRQAGR